MCKASGLEALLPNSLRKFIGMIFAHKQFWFSCWLEMHVAMKGLPPSVALVFYIRAGKEVF